MALKKKNMNETHTHKISIHQSYMSLSLSGHEEEPISHLRFITKHMWVVKTVEKEGMCAERRENVSFSGILREINLTFWEVHLLSR